VRFGTAYPPTVRQFQYLLKDRGRGRGRVDRCTVRSLGPRCWLRSHSHGFRGRHHFEGQRHVFVMAVASPSLQRNRWQALWCLSKHGEVHVHEDASPLRFSLYSTVSNDP